MSRQVNRFDRLEQDTHQIKLNLAILTERAETFVTKNDFNALASRADAFATKNDIRELATREELAVIRNDLSLLRVEMYKAITGQNKWRQPVCLQ